MIEKKTQCKELKDAVVTLRKLSGDELQQAIYEAELDAKRVQNAAIKTAKREGFEQGEAKGETNAKIEAAINLIKKMNITLDQAISILEIDASYRSQIEVKLKELGIN